MGLDSYLSIFEECKVFAYLFIVVDKTLLFQDLIH